MEEMLSRLGLERFTEIFVAEEVDLEALSLFEEQDLKDLGLPKGPRVKLLRALQGVFANPEVNLPQDAGYMQSRLDGLGTQLNDLGQQLSTVEQRLSSTCEELADVVARQRAEEDDYEEPEDDGNVPLTNVDGRPPGAVLVTGSVDELWAQVRELGWAVQTIQEIAPSRVCWTIQQAAEKISATTPGKSLRAPPFSLCGSIVGMKLEFYPSGRGRVPDTTDDRTLPEITPRVHPSNRDQRRGARALLAEDGPCSISICCPMGVKLQYRLQIGQTQSFDNCHVQWSSVYHDCHLRWRDELAADGSLSIVITAVRVHNKRLRIHNDTVFVQSD